MKNVIIGYQPFDWHFPDGSSREGYELYIVNELDPDKSSNGSKSGFAWRSFKDKPTKPKYVSSKKFEELLKSAKSGFLFKSCKVHYNDVGTIESITWFE